jgi:hypothetical protein
MVRAIHAFLFFGLGIGLAVGCGGSSGSDLSSGGTKADAGTDGDLNADADQGDGATGDSSNPNDPLNAAPTCTSGKTWTLGDRGSSLMHPGDMCITCHTQKGGPDFTIAGTVFPSGHEPTDCNGSSGAAIGLQVVITDANGKVTSLGVNSVGNFYSYAPSSGGPSIAFPIHAKVVANGGKERAMSAAQTDGNCNSCHTQNGANSAPGRITAPY